MDQTRARELQEKLALEAAAMLSLAGSGAETAPYAHVTTDAQLKAAQTMGNILSRAV